MGTLQTTETLEEESGRKEDWIFYDIELVAGRKNVKFVKDELLLLKAWKNRMSIRRKQPGVGRAPCLDVTSNILLMTFQALLVFRGTLPRLELRRAVREVL